MSNPLTFDLEEIERRVMARIFNKGDLHAQRASKEFGIPEEEVTPEQRAYAKRLNLFDAYTPPRRQK